MSIPSSTTTRRIEDVDGLFDRCTDEGTSCATTICCSAFVPTAIAAHRIGWQGTSICVGLLFVIFIICYAAHASILTNIQTEEQQPSFDYYHDMSNGQTTTTFEITQTTMSEEEQEELQEMVATDAMVMMFVHASIIILMIVLGCMRTALLKRHGSVDGDGCGSCLRAYFCTPCLAAQMMRWTDGRFEKMYPPSVEVYATATPVGTDKIMEYGAVESSGPNSVPSKEEV